MAASLKLFFRLLLLAFNGLSELKRSSRAIRDYSATFNRTSASCERKRKARNLIARWSELMYISIPPRKARRSEQKVKEPRAHGGARAKEMLFQNDDGKE